MIPPSNTGPTRSPLAFRTAWKASLQHQMKAVPPFDKIFTRTILVLEAFTKQAFKTKNTLIDQTRTKP